MRRKIFLIMALILASVLPVRAETSYRDFVDYAWTWLGDDPDALWRMSRDEVRARLETQEAFSCRPLIGPASPGSYFYCKSADRLTGDYRMRFYFSGGGLLEAVEFRAEDELLQTFAEAYGGQLPAAQTLWKDLTDRYGDSGRCFPVPNTIFTDGPAGISAQASIGRNTCVLIGQHEPGYSFERYALLFVFCSDGYAARRR